MPHRRAPAPTLGRTCASVCPRHFAACNESRPLPLDRLDLEDETIAPSRTSAPGAPARRQSACAGCSHAFFTTDALLSSQLEQNILLRPRAIYLADKWTAALRCWNLPLSRRSRCRGLSSAAVLAAPATQVRLKQEKGLKKGAGQKSPAKLADAPSAGVCTASAGTCGAPSQPPGTWRRAPPQLDTQPYHSARTDGNVRVAAWNRRAGSGRYRRGSRACADHIMRRWLVILAALALAARPAAGW